MTFGGTRVTIQTRKTPRMRRKAAFGVFCLTTVYPTSTHGVHGYSGGKSAGKDVFGSGKGRKCLKLSGNRCSQILWEQDIAGSKLVIYTTLINQYSLNASFLYSAYSFNLATISTKAWSSLI